jgi:hypothetical protein
MGDCIAVGAMLCQTARLLINDQEVVRGVRLERFFVGLGGLLRRPSALALAAGEAPVLVARVLALVELLGSRLDLVLLGLRASVAGLEPAAEVGVRRRPVVTRGEGLADRKVGGLEVMYTPTLAQI